MRKSYHGSDRGEKGEKPMRKVAIPASGYYNYAFNALGRSLGFEVVDIPRTSSRTMSLGSEIAPEGICICFPLLLGSYAEAVERGADSCVFIGGYGACRQFCYGHLYKLLFKKHHPDVDFYVLYYENFFEVINELAGQTIPRLEVLKAFLRLVRDIWLVEKIEDLSWYYRPREKHRGDTTRVMDDCYELFEKGSRSLSLFRRKFARIETKDVKPLRMGVIGEIYLLIEPHVNCNTDIVLGENGVHIHKFIRLFMEILRALHLNERFTNYKHRDEVRLAWPYLKVSVAGHGRTSVADMVRYHHMGFDGVVHLLPMGCLPEISARPFLKKIGSEHKFPLLTLSLDEMTSESATRNRIEAFVDMVRARK